MSAVRRSRTFVPVPQVSVSVVISPYFSINDKSNTAGVPLNSLTLRSVEYDVISHLFEAVGVNGSWFTVSRIKERTNISRAPRCWIV